MPENLGENRGVAVLRVAGGEDDRDLAAAGAAAQSTQLRWVGGELGPVAPSEFLEALGRMAVPPAQLVTRGQIPRPLVQRCAVSGDAAWPHPIDQHPIAIIRGRRLVDALAPDHVVALHLTQTLRPARGARDGAHAPYRVRTSVPMTVSRHFRALPLFWRVFMANATVLVAATLALALAPVKVSVPITLGELVVLLAGLLAMLLVNVVFLRRTLRPLRALTETMADVNLLVPGRRVDVGEAGRDTRQLAAAFNSMLERLEAERRESAEMALAVQEGERRRIARELHDEVGQTLTAMLLQIESFYADAPSELRGHLDELRETTRSGAEDVRRIARRLRPEALEELGLQSALVVLSDLFAEQTGVRISRRIQNDLELSAQDELVVYRVAQEALTNIARHAEATRAELELGRDGDGAVVLLVSDDGRGFDVAAQPRSYGVRGMRERAMLIGASIRIESAKRKGTTIVLRVPRKDG
jgi:two-component system sensor histidine kinase UhpB